MTGAQTEKENQGSGFAIGGFSAANNPFLSRYMVLALEIVFILLLAYFGALLFWLVTDGAPAPAVDLEAPIARVASAPSVNTDIIGSFDPFFPGSAGPSASRKGSEERLAQAENAPETKLDLKLFGTRFTANAGASSERSSAVIQDPRGQQLTLSVGDTVLPGVKLYAVNPLFVTLLREGRLERLSLEKTDGLIKTASAPPPSRLTIASPQKQRQMARQQHDARAPKPPAQADRPANGREPRSSRSNALVTQAQFQTLLDSVTLQPILNGRQVEGWSMDPGGQNRLFNDLGLKRGDILKRVNGRSMKNAERITELMSELNGASNVALLIERDGKDMTVTFDYGG